MKRTAVCLVSALLAGMSVAPAEATKKVSREAVDTYGLPWPGSPSTGQGCFGDDNCPSFPISGSERWVTIEVIDESGTPAPFKIAQSVNASGNNAETVGGPFCGSTGRRPVRLRPGAEVLVRVYAFGDTACPGSVGTSGTVRAVFSNLP